MTRDEIVRSLSERWRFSIAEDSAIWNDVRAALRERDAEWAKALTKAAYSYHCELGERFRVPCSGCQLLRALLEEAGK